MDVQATLFELSAMREHLDALIRGIESGDVGEDDFGAFQIQIEHLLDHLCFAWNARELSGKQRAKLSQEEFERLIRVVPNPFGNRTLQ